MWYKWKNKPAIVVNNFRVLTHDGSGNEMYVRIGDLYNHSKDVTTNFQTKNVTFWHALGMHVACSIS